MLGAIALEACGFVDQNFLKLVILTIIAWRSTWIECFINFKFSNSGFIQSLIHSLLVYYLGRRDGIEQRSATQVTRRAFKKKKLVKNTV